MEHTQGPEQSLNLGQHRSEASVWDRRGWDGHPQGHMVTRLLVGVGGGALAVQGLRLGSWKGRMLAGIGGSLAWLAITGERELPEPRRWFPRTLRRRHGHDDAMVMEASDESFPASDAPSWTPTVGTGLRRSPGRH